ncbi:hypothetical protein P4O66_003247 [Electrophorus voltai]|uniref:Uncharacterized protein n=1 Tax=Electrophorus voltai TaxID=2609070 RepID=A0AAD9DKI8_9TELE|nr:hypothetical protein P4O66_003247 [Electrophorus voltai]
MSEPLRNTEQGKGYERDTEEQDMGYSYFYLVRLSVLCDASENCRMNKEREESVEGKVQKQSTTEGGAKGEGEGWMSRRQSEPELSNTLTGQQDHVGSPQRYHHRRWNLSNLTYSQRSAPSHIMMAGELWNCQSGVQKADFISALASLHFLHFLALTETWITPENPVTPAALSSAFSFTHSPRRLGRGGGTEDVITFFEEKVAAIHQSFSSVPTPPTNVHSPTSNSLTSFSPLSTDEILQLLTSSNLTTCPLDPIPSVLFQTIENAKGRQ